MTHHSLPKVPRHVLVHPPDTHTRKGAAFVEYVSLIGLIGVVVIFAIVQFSGELGDSFDRTTTTLDDTIIVGEDDTPGTPPGGDPDGDPDLPDPPIFPPPLAPDSGLDHAFTYDVYMSYWDPTSITFDQIADAIEAEAVAARGQGGTPSWYYSGNPPADWNTDVTWTGLERSEPWPDPNQAFPYNEFAFTVAGFSHNVGPQPGWGDGAESASNCLASIPNSEQYQVRGHLSNGDQILIYLNLPPQDCVPSFNVSRSVGITHSSGGIYPYGSVANAELADAGIPNPYDWNAATWVVDYWDGNPDNGLTYSGLALGATRYQWNTLAGPAWYYSSDPSGEDTTCYESPFSTYGTVIGTHPDGAILTLNLDFYPIIGDGEEGTGGDCFESFGP